MSKEPIKPDFIEVDPVESETSESSTSEEPTTARKGEDTPRLNLMPYPTSTLSPQIIPNDLTTFKSRGASMVEKELRQRLTEMKEEYEQVIDSFNWNKLVYESEFGFEPVMGQRYHLYEIEAGHRRLSMVPPVDWPQYRWLGTFRLNVDRRWEAEATAEDFDLRDIAGSESQ